MLAVAQFFKLSHCLRDSMLEDNFGPELQAAAANAIGDDVAGKSVAPIEVECVTTELIDAIHGVDSVIHILDWYPKPLMVKQVERLCLELDGETLGYSRILKYSHVDCTDGLAPLRIAT